MIINCEKLIEIFNNDLHYLLTKSQDNLKKASDYGFSFVAFGNDGDCIANSLSNSTYFYHMDRCGSYYHSKYVDLFLYFIKDISLACDSRCESALTSRALQDIKAVHLSGNNINRDEKDINSEHIKLQAESVDSHVNTQYVYGDNSALIRCRGIDAVHAQLKQEHSQLKQARCDFYKKDIQKIAIGVSGGSDSLALLMLVHQFCKDNKNFQIKAFTVNHALRSESLSEALYIKSICEKFNIEHEILTWHHDNITSALEEQARNARYELLIDACYRHDCEHICIGHTWDDQIETFMIRETSKSGESGLACMTRLRELSYGINILRPILRFKRKTLRNFLNNLGISWVDDPSNECEKFLRVKMRNKKNTINREEINLKIINAGIKRYRTEKTVVDALLNWKKHEINQIHKDNQNNPCYQNNQNININEKIDIKPINKKNLSCILINKNIFSHQNIDDNNQNNGCYYEFFQRIIVAIGGKEYKTTFDIGKILHQENGKLITLGNCIIKSLKKFWQIEYEHRKEKDNNLTNIYKYSLKSQNIKELAKIFNITNRNIIKNKLKLKEDDLYQNYNNRPIGFLDVFCVFDDLDDKEISIYLEKLDL